MGYAQRRKDPHLSARHINILVYYNNRMDNLTNTKDVNVTEFEKKLTIFALGACKWG
jgi:hypothetical protein